MATLLQRGLGQHDDGREGVLLTKIAQGELVKVPLAQSAQYVPLGTSTVGHGQSKSGNDGALYGGSFTIPAGLTQGGAIRETLWGRVIGVRWQRSNAPSTLFPFSVIVDGVCYPVRDVVNRKDTVAYGASDNDSLYVVVDDLPTDGPHTVEVNLQSDPYGGTQRQMTLFGWLLERAKGYERYWRSGMYQTTPQAITTSAATITSPGTCRKLTFLNTTSSAITVTIQYYGTGTFRQLIVPANTDSATSGFAEHDFGTPVNIETWKILASATGVNVWALQAEADR